MLVLLAGVKVVGIFILIRRRRRMVQEAILNGTYVPPTSPNLTIRPELWEAYLGGSSGWELGSGKKEDRNWKSEYSRNYWESIKPIYAGLAKPLADVRVPYSGSSPNLPTSFSQPASIPVSTPINQSAPRGDDEENQLTAEVPTTPPSLLTPARIFLNLNSPVPASSPANNNGTNSHSISAMSLSNPPPQPMIRVVVLIAMPSPTPFRVSTTPLSASASSSLSSKKSQPTITSHSPELSPSPTTTLRFTDDGEQPVPYLEMGVADVVVVRSRTTKDSSTWDSNAYD